LAAGFCPKNLAFARKIAVLPVARMPMVEIKHLADRDR